MSTTVTNRTAAPAQRGQGVVVTLNATDSAQLANMTVGATVSNGSSKSGVIAKIDLYGKTFIVNPNLPSNKFDSTSTPSILAVGETITF